MYGFCFWGEKISVDMKKPNFRQNTYLTILVFYGIL